MNFDFGEELFATEFNSPVRWNLFWALLFASHVNNVIKSIFISIYLETLFYYGFLCDLLSTSSSANLSIKQNDDKFPKEVRDQTNYFIFWAYGRIAITSHLITTYKDVGKY